MKDKDLTPRDISVLKYYKEGNELCGFEGVHSNLVGFMDEGHLDDDLRLTPRGREFIKNFKDWDTIEAYNNTTRITIR